MAWDAAMHREVRSPARCGPFFNTLANDEKRGTVLRVSRDAIATFLKHIDNHRAAAANGSIAKPNYALWPDCGGLGMLTCRHRVDSSMSCLGTLVRLVACALADESLEEKRVVLKDGDRIIFFGDSLTALAGQE